MVKLKHFLNIKMRSDFFLPTYGLEVTDEQTFLLLLLKYLKFGMVVTYPETNYW